MRTVLSARTSGVEVLDGTAERIPLADASADAVFVGDAFHWFDGAAAVAERANVSSTSGSNSFTANASRGAAISARAAARPELK